MGFQLSADTKIPAYQQIADWLGGRIHSGELQEGDRLPAERTLCAETGTARGTVKLAYHELEKRGLVRIVRGSGVYVTRPAPQVHSPAEKAIQEAVAALRELGLGKGDIAALAQSCAWDRLQDEERPRLAWVDCNPEMLEPIARQIEVECGFSVATMLLADVAGRPELLEREYFHAIASSIEHCEELDRCARGVLDRIGATVDRVVLSLTPETIGGIAAIEPGERIAVVHDSKDFLVCAQRYLAELGVRSAPVSIHFGADADALFDDDTFQWVILPPDEQYHGGACGRIARKARQQGVRLLFLRHAVDFGSVRHLLARARSFH